jgi:tetratricopeptide (TPR) repeat protein
VTDSFTVPVDVELLAVYPHAHFLAKTMESSAKLPDGTERALLRIRDWDFKWQDVYRYARPIALPRGTTIRMKFTYDNSAANPRNPSRPPARVVAGLRSTDEMAHLQFQVLPRSDDDAVLLKEALNRHTIEKTPSDEWAHYELANALRDSGRVAEAIREYRTAIGFAGDHAAARNNLGALLGEGGEIDEAIRQYREALRSEPDFVDAHYNLANALRSKGLLDDAAAHYREALRLEPDLGEAHTNLGEILAARGSLDEAIVEFRTAVRLRPESAQAHNNLGAALGLQGKLGEAIEEFRRALQIEPDHERARENLRRATASR